eukprot:CAMPEP_0198430214 /NCGR_PEP_ID=MMETSP1452-20131203/12149_1 /TAXON_ID=1181717 /ORGANISM="Synchroma pusillum, Strain CCMP3072" /LENGTH=169 /DNA_ID=CAMNT_0044150649 /DNA_START=12 /DNA_END=518 /DNA_ORIENTATION=-
MARRGSGTSGFADGRRGSAGSVPGENQTFRIYYETADVGKNYSASKRRVKWKFCYGVEGNERSVQLTHSALSGKKVIEEDGVVIQTVHKLSTEFQHSWESAGHVLRIEIVEMSSHAYLFSIDGVPFDQLPERGINMPRRFSESEDAAARAERRRSSKQAQLAAATARAA